MPRQIIMWVLDRVLLDIASTATPIAPQRWPYGILLFAVLGTMIGGTLLFSFGVGINTLYTEFVSSGLSPKSGLFLVILISIATSFALALSVTALIKKVVLKKPAVSHPINRALEDVAMAAIGIATSFIRGFNETKKRRVRIELKDDRAHATIIPLRRKRY